MTLSGSRRASGPYAGQKIHFIGAGGCGMSGLAEFVLSEGGDVSGSDMTASAATERLVRRGADIGIGHGEKNIPSGAHLVVHSAAVKPDNAEMAEAVRRGIPTLKYAQFLGRLMELRLGIAVSGTHGKSTTTAMVAYVLSEAGLDPSFVIGADVPQLGGGSHVGDGPHLVVEACEYDRSFVNLSPHAAVVLNVEEDHLDYFRDLDDIRSAFAEFASRVTSDGLLLVCGSDPGSRDVPAAAKAAVRTFGIGGDWDWRAENLRPDAGRFAFDVVRQGAMYASVRLALAGEHHVLNALAAMALCTWAGAPAEAVAGALGRFQGASRRMEVLGQAGGVTVVDDYAHHPTEIRATLRAARERFSPARLWVVFQPHQHSRTRFLLKDFARALTVADKVIVPDIYFVRDSENERHAVSSQDLVAEVTGLGTDAAYFEDFDSIRRHLVESLGSGDVLITMGAGDVWHLASPLLAGLAGLAGAEAAPR
ncbi:MAG TPA: UDP-N-acetylmuramate--L-alanine ligase [Phycisphaerae bacterium]|nr:UDP-N-acetylmuramate--L-alanine ligase [Phycisphaerae bacterium]